jgi:hypothetical protein
MGNIGLTRDELLIVLREWNGAKAVTEFLIKEAVENNAARNGQTIVLPVIQFVGSMPPPPAPPPVSPGHLRYFSTSEVVRWRDAIAAARPAVQAVRAAANNPTVRTTAVGTGAGTGGATTLVSAFSAAVSEAFGASSLSTIGAASGGAIVVAGICVLVAGAVGVGIGVGIDHLVGAVRDDGRGLSDLMSGANKGVPVQDPTGHGTEGWRFVSDGK